MSLSSWQPMAFSSLMWLVGLVLLVDTCVQYNKAGAFGGDSNLTWSYSTQIFTITNGAGGYALTINKVGSASIQLNSTAVNSGPQILFSGNNGQAYVGIDSFYNDVFGIGTGGASKLSDILLMTQGHQYLYLSNANSTITYGNSTDDPSHNFWGNVTIQSHVIFNKVSNNQIVLNSTGPDYGIIGTPSFQVWGLGYGAAPFATVNFPLTWDTTGNVTVANVLQIGPNPIVFDGNFASPTRGRLYIGDGTGWNFYISTFSTDLVKFTDGGDVQINESGTYISLTKPNWQTPSFGANVANYGAPFANAAYYKDATGRVYLRGLTTSTGNIPSGGTILSGLPAPAFQSMFCQLNNGGTPIRCDVTTSGTLIWEGSVISGSGFWITLEGISYQTK